MGWIGAIGSFLGGKTGEKVMDFADKAIYSKQERATDDKEDLKDVRAMQFDGLLGKLVDLYSCSNSGLASVIILLMIFCDVVVELSARLIRPAVTILLIGHLFGFWKLDMPDTDEFTKTLAYLAFTFWFGGRAIMKDVPKMLAVLRKK